MTHYDTLEVSPKASAEVIRAAYKSLMQRHHPDKQIANPAPNTAAASTSDHAAHIAHAYGVLSDPAARSAYDLELQALTPTPAQQQWAQARTAGASAGRGAGGARSSAATAAAPRTKQPGAATWHSWYAGVLIVLILVAGTVLLRNPKKPPLPVAAAPQGAGAANPSGLEASAAGTSGLGTFNSAAVAAAALAARTLPAYANNLAVPLATTPDATGRTLVLTLPDLGLRINTPDAPRWVQQLRTQRETVLRQVLGNLALAQPDALRQPDADVYLKRLVATAVMQSIGLNPAQYAVPAAPPADPTLAWVQPVEVLLPQGFAVQ